MFTLYINDLPNIVSVRDIESYVDDTKLFLSFNSFDTDLALASVSQDLHRFVEWLCQHQLLINPDKTKFILFGTKQRLGKLFNPTVSILGKTLTPEKVCKIWASFLIPV